MYYVLIILQVGKSHLLRTMIDAVKYLKLNPGADLKKPAIVVMAPTANAAYIIGGRTIDSALGFNPADKNRYVPAQPSHLATLKFLFDEARVLVIDEVKGVFQS